MKKKLLIAASCFMLSLGVKAQYNQSGGVGLIYGTGALPNGAQEGTEKPSILGYGAFFYPRYNLTESDGSAISVGFPMTLGLGGNYNSQTGSSLSITADIPLTADFNFGAGSTEDNDSGIGGFVGAGFGYTYTNQTYQYSFGGGTEQVKGSSYGPLAHAGIKASIGEKIYFLRASYKLGLETAKYKTIGLAVGVSF